MNSKQKPKRKWFNYFIYDFVRITGALPVLFWFKTKTIFANKKNFPKMKSFLLCANHSTYTDPIVLMSSFWYRRISFIATNELFNTKLKKFFFTQTHCIEVDRSNFSMQTFYAVKEKLNSGKVVGIFPEGKLNNEQSNEFLMFKSGAVLIAHQCNVPIVPAYIVPKESWFKRRVVIVGEPINVREFCGTTPSMQDINRCCEMLRGKELELKEMYLNRRKKNEKSN